MAEIVVDASAMLAAIFAEPGEALVRRHAGVAVASMVNISEVYARAAERGLSESLIEAAIGALVVERHPFGEGDDLRAARLRPLTKHLGLSLADRACLALAQRLGLPVLTADRRWQKLDIGIDVRLIR